MIEIRDVYKTYHMGDETVNALQGVSLQIGAGEFVAIMGPSGSGKSTLMHLLGFLDKPDQGTLRFLGKDVSDLEEADYAYLRNRVIGFIFQQFNLLARKSALENVALPLMYAGDAASNGALSRPEKLLAEVGLQDRIRHRPNEMSGGQQQRVAIARSLVNQPRVILADEPTGSLDSKSGEEVLQIFKKLHAQGMTVILVTHDINVAKHADRILKMQDGKLVSDESKKARMPSDETAAHDIPVSMERGRFTIKEFKDYVRQAVNMILSNKARSFLSMLGVLIGVACVIAILAMGRGARESITEQLARLGSNVLSVRPGSSKVRGVALEPGAATRLMIVDAKAIKESVSSVARVAPQVSGRGQLAFENKNWNTRVVGTTPDYAPMLNQEPVAGRFFTDSENESRKRNVVIGQTIARELFSGENPVGKIIKINRINFQVIGILPELGSDSWRDRDDLVVIPLMTAMRRLLGRDYLDQIDVEIASADEMEGAEAEIRDLIIRRHRLTGPRVESFDIRNFAQVQEALSSATKTFSVLLSVVAAISLLVGGIGIMNIMLVSVTERTREIGLRKAIGAAPRDILAQFLTEAVVITFIGGTAGAMFGIGISYLLTVLAGWKTVITLGSILLSFIFSVAIGIIFGLWPARKASLLNPIDALRYE